MRMRRARGSDHPGYAMQPTSRDFSPVGEMRHQSADDRVRERPGEQFRKSRDPRESPGSQHLCATTLLIEPVCVGSSIVSNALGRMDLSIKSIT
jgi:hypothetical protein